MAKAKKEVPEIRKDHSKIPTPSTSKKMRKNTKVARVSCCCKLSMLVPHLQKLSSRMQPEHKHEKARTSFSSNS
jgi:hypothetical protein